MPKTGYLPEMVVIYRKWWLPLRRKAPFGLSIITVFPVFEHLVPLPFLLIISKSGPSAVRSDKVVKTVVSGYPSGQNSDFPVFWSKSLSRSATKRHFCKTRWVGDTGLEISLIVKRWLGPNSRKWLSPVPEMSLITRLFQYMTCIPTRGFMPFYWINGYFT